MSEIPPNDAIRTLGTIIDATHKRDAIHLAVFAAQAKQKLFAGQDVSADGDGIDPLVGIVDPFLKVPVFPGDWFWIVVYPRTITSLRHVWQHPLIDSATDQEASKPTPAPGTEASERWIRDYCVRIGCRYEEIMNAADQWVRHEDYWVNGGRWEDTQTDDEFWTHYEVVSGTEVAAKRRTNFFSCSC